MINTNYVAIFHGCAAVRVLLQRVCGMMCAALLVACTSVPVKEFASYREAVDKARAAAEVVLTDYSAALAEQRVLMAARKPEKPKRPGAFDPMTAGGDGANLDYVAVRYQAWAIVGKYNDALASLAEGRSAADVGGAVDGLINSLNQSPFAEAQEFATALAPFLGPLKVLLAEADKEASRQRFLAGLKTGLPLIKDDLIALLKKDSQLMAEVRFGLNDLQYERSLDRVNDAKRRFDRLSINYASTEEVRQMQAEIAAALAKLPRDSDGKSAPLRSPAKSGSQEAMTAAVLAELESQRTQTINEIAGAMRVNDALLAYYDVLGAYVKLLNKMAASTGQLFQAAETGQKFVLPSDELLKAVIALRQSYLTYAEKK
jgi:hypothetical protein